MGVQETEKLKQICSVIHQTVDTEKIYLFGSYAYGVPTQNSDFDLCVIIPDNDLPPGRRDQEDTPRLISGTGYAAGYHRLSQRGFYQPSADSVSGTQNLTGRRCCYMHKEWLEFAAMDLDSAQFLLGMRPVPVEIICYRCEQAAEKLLKAVLVAADVEPPKHTI